MTRRRFRPAIALITLGSLLASCGGGGGGGGTPPVSPTSTPSGYSEAAFQCPSSDTSLAHARFSSGMAADTAVRRLPNRRVRGAVSNNLLVVSYATSVSTSNALDTRIAALGAKTINDRPFTYIGRSMRLVRVTPATLASTQAALRAVPGVKDVSPSRHLVTETVNGPYFRGNPGLPYFAGDPGNNPAPLYQTATVGGQWDMNIIGLGQAFDYSQAANGSNVNSVAGALGSTSIKLAIVDSGEDVTHPDLSGATIAETKCFLTDPNGNSTTGTFVTDGLGHGTDVTGIAAASSSTPNYGFTGTSGNVSLLLYRVFPTPDDNCIPGYTGNDPQCSADDADIASAISDAVANHANVINLSLGIGQTCVTPGPGNPGGDTDVVEGNAVENAIAANIIVVASSGNDSSTSGASSPACDTGVIAVGATSYNDGQPNGTGYTGANPEYVANYSDLTTGGSANSIRNASSWGIVAPGGDPVNNDADSLHWVENIWTTTPYVGSPGDMNFTGDCSAGEFNETNNCRTLIAGTSMSSPHVAGAAALILSVNPSYGTPAKMKQLLCSEADDIGDPNQGCGRLNVYNAMAIAAGDNNPPTPVP